MAVGLERWPYQMVEHWSKVLHVNRFDTIPVLDRETDGEN